ncbi:hypothetical protein NEF87_002327 [Candidatus Lokiarchaeum ossiferum]|uniref:Solute-binding protein family 5 domain-containing protein n=1 Tax=Candidatus Lokiarchaeum ossiferum TaxID=2951803 RepID=A0ABY6HUM0_9ARCH|nr:hypothetical protein NEF87_002327 [Candidatus Lokiarchaeum sp. B-35]
MKKNNRTIGFFLIFTFVISTAIQFSSATAAVPERNEIVWCTGYDSFVENLNPWDPTQSFGIALVYEPLFGFNGATDKLIPVLGTTYSWNADGSELTVTVTDQAEWSDGEAVDANDVKYSYELAAAQSRWEGMSDLWDSITVSGNDVVFAMSDNNNYNFQMEQYLHTDIPIIPQHVFTEICHSLYNASTDIGALETSEFTNDWHDATFNEDWKVTSGPYVPYSRDMTAQEEIFVYREDWWGAEKIHMDIPEYDGTPDAKYVALRAYSDNTAADTAILTGEVDLHSGYYASVWTALAANEHLETWFGRSFEEFYLGLGSTVEIAPNHLKFPFNQLWFREAVAYSINYDIIPSAAASGYWSRSRQGVIDNRSASHLSEYDADVQAEYGVDYDFDAALAIMNEHCFKLNTSLPLYSAYNDETWYTNVSAEYQGELGAETDMIPEMTGFQVAVDDYEILVPAGWTDVVIATAMWAADMSALGITTVKKEVDFDNVWIVKDEEGDFDMIMQCCTPEIGENPFTIMSGWQGEYSRPWNNASWWESADFAGNYTAYAQAAPEDRATYMSNMQEILAKEKPTIVSHVNGFWYLTNTENWENWPSADNYWQDPQTSYSINKYALKQRLYLGLKSTGSSSGGIPWSGFGFSIFAGLIIVAAIQTMKMRKRN